MSEGVGRLVLRPLVSSDPEVLREILHVARWDPPPAPPRPRGFFDHPEVRIYAEDRESARANPAAHVYRRCGVVQVDMRRTCFVMVCGLESPT